MDQPKSIPRLPFSAGLVVSLSIIVTLLVMYWFRAVFTPLLLAMALAYILEPLVQWLMRRKFSRVWAVTVVLLSFLMMGAGAVAWLVFESVEFVTMVLGGPEGEAGKLIQGLNRLFDSAEAKLKEIEAPIQLTEIAKGLSDADFLKGQLGVVSKAVLETFKGLHGSIELLLVGVLVPIYLFYMMLDLSRILEWFKLHLPAANRQHTLSVFSQLHAGMSAFLRGRVIISLIKGVITAIGLLFCGTPMAIVVGMLAGVLSIVPLLGPVIGFVTALALTLADEMSVGNMVLVVVVFGVAEVLENFVITPAVMKQGADLHPLTILFCVVFWGAALGAFGALVAIPLTLVTKVLFQEYVMPSVRSLATSDDC